jgi:hypothetical protein
MARSRVSGVLAAFSVASCFAVTFALGDFAYTPCILNGSGLPIRYVATFTDGTSAPGSLPPASAAWQHIRGRQLRSLVVDRGGAKHTYGASALDQLRREQTVANELWVIGEQGITLEDRGQIETVRKRASKPPK